MRVLIVSATAGEASPVRETFADGVCRGHQVALLVTGVGLVATAARVATALSQQQYDLAINIGVCGSFDAALPPGTAVHVVSECLPELGAEDGDEFLSARELQLVGADEFPFRNGCLVPLAPAPNAALDRLPRVRGISVNTVHGNDASIAAVVRRWSPQVESMEGAAFVYACLIHQVPSAQVRVVSNMVERRNRATWKMTEAIEVLGKTALAVLDDV